jgi:hypothetical protein
MGPLCKGYRYKTKLSGKFEIRFERIDGLPSPLFFVQGTSPKGASGPLSLDGFIFAGPDDGKNPADGAKIS